MRRIVLTPLVVSSVLCGPQASTLAMPVAVSSAPLNPPRADAGDPARPTPAEVIEKAGRRPWSGAVSEGRALLVWTAGYGTIENKRWWTAYRLMDGDRVVSERLFSRKPATDVLVTVEGMPGGFLATGYGGAPRFVSTSGAVSSIALSSEPVSLRAGDVPVGIGGLLYRPGTRTVHTMVRAPGKTVATHAADNGSWWALGGIRDGHQVLWSRKPGRTWAEHLVGAQEPYVPGCTCPWEPSVEGRGPVVVASMGPVNHISLDYGTTWQTYDLGDSEPFRTVYDNLREPITSALADGRIVTGYGTYWVATDPGNTSYRMTPWSSLVMWRAGLSQSPVRRGDSVSVDGGQTWLPLDPPVDATSSLDTR